MELLKLRREIRPRISFPILILLIALTCSVQAQPIDASSTPVAITGVNVVDVVEGQVLPNQTVIVNGNQITGIGHADSLEVPNHSRIINARDNYLTPGLWDMHVHLDDLPHLHMTTEEKQIALPMYVINGVTGVRDMGGNLNQLNDWRMQSKSGKIVAPEIVAAGPYDPTHWPYNNIKVTTASEARKAVRILNRTRGVDFIKVYQGIPREAYFALAEEANRLGISFAGHLPFSIILEEAIEAGQRSFEHGDPIGYRCTERASELQSIVQSVVNLPQNDPDYAKGIMIYLGIDRYVLDSFDANTCREILTQLAEADTWYTPTNVAFNGMGLIVDSTKTDDRFETLHPSYYAYWKQISPNPDSTARIQEFANSRYRLTEALHEAGVSLLAGSDGPQLFYAFPGSSLHDELALMVKAGLSPIEALRTATINPAEYLGRDYEMGTIAVDNLADLVLLDDNPLKDINNVRKIHTVVLKGKLLNRVALDSMINEVKSKVQEYNNRE